LAESKKISYINKEFSEYKKTLEDFLKVYYPTTFNDFSEASPATAFLDIAAMVGDVLSFYQDKQFNENFLLYAKEKENLYGIAYQMGYKPQVTSPSFVELSVRQLIPSIIVSSSASPNFDYASTIDSEASVSSISTGVEFLIQDPVDFSFSSSFDPTNIQVYSTNNITGLPEYYLLTKRVKAISATLKTQTISIGDVQKFYTTQLSDTDIIGILDVYDSDGNKWYEVDYLAQETILEGVKNTYNNSPSLSQYTSDSPYLMKLRKVPRRFVTRFKSTGILEMEFGAGVFSTPDEELIPNPNNVGLGITNGISKLDVSYDPKSFMFTNSYGISPRNTILTIRYLTGGGLASNLPSQDIANIQDVTINLSSNLDVNISNIVRNSLSIINESPSSGGKGGDTVDDIRQKSLASFSTQNRVVTKEDYVIRCLSMPPKFGSVAKVYASQDYLFSNDNSDNLIDNNPLAISLYTLGYNQDKKLTNISNSIKENLKVYLSQYRMLSDSILIQDAFFINFGLDFDIVVLPDYNAKLVLLDCINSLKEYFNIDKWQINQPIYISEVYGLISNIDGVQSVKKVNFRNISGDNYSPYVYDIKGAERQNIIYPSLDPMIFELRYPDVDIKGRIVNF